MCGRRGSKQVVSGCWQGMRLTRRVVGEEQSEEAGQGRAGQGREAQGKDV